MRNAVSLRRVVACAAMAAGGGAAACSRDVQAVSPQELQQRYGITDAFAGQVATADGMLRGTLVPVTLPDGRRAELVIPDGRAGEPHAAYFRDGDGLHPIEIADNVERSQLAGAPLVVNRGTGRDHPRHRSWEKEVLIIGGSAGTAIGALAGGKKGAGIGAAAGGVGGLIYDLATRTHR